MTYLQLKLSPNMHTTGVDSNNSCCKSKSNRAHLNTPFTLTTQLTQLLQLMKMSEVKILTVPAMLFIFVSQNQHSNTNHCLTTPVHRDIFILGKKAPCRVTVYEPFTFFFCRLSVSVACEIWTTAVFIFNNEILFFKLNFSFFV